MGARKRARRPLSAELLGGNVKRSRGLTTVRVAETRTTTEYVEAEGPEGFVRLTSDLAARQREGWSVVRAQIFFRREESISDE